MTLIKTHDGTIYDLIEYGIRTKDVLISAPTPEHEFQDIEGMNGVIDYGTTYGPREITCQYRAIANDRTDFSLMRDEIFNLFRTEKSFYLIEKRIQGKQWLVKVANSYQIPQRNIFGYFEIDFIGLTGFSESIKTTADIDKNGLRYGDGWSYGMGLLYDDESHKYTHTGTSFKIYNAGDVPIHPFEQELKITIDDVVGSSEYLQLENTTNGTSFKVTEGVGSNQTIVLDGANITSNGTQYLRKTNRQFIELNPGWNKFKITGASSARVAFDHPFYYL